VSAREAFARLVYEDQAMNDLGFLQANVFTMNSVDTPKDLNQFIVIADSGSEKAFGTTGATVVTYWVHRSKRLGIDYGQIDLALIRLRELLVDVQHFGGSDGWVLSCASWVDQSGDLQDDGFSTITKFATFRAAVRNIVVT
jgi:hypothetical protein